MGGVRRFGAVLLVAVVLVAAGGCARRWQARFATTSQYRELDPDAPFLEVHARSGELYVLERWSIWEREREVRGVGIHYDRNRHVVGEGPATIPFDSVALLESTRPRDVPRTGLLLGFLGAIVGVAFLACVGGVCE